MFDRSENRSFSTVRIARQFRGPEASGNGGYTCGLIARAFDAPVCVRLQSPPPLERDLTLRMGEADADLMDDETVIARAHVCDLELALPDPPLVDAAIAAGIRFAEWFDSPYQQPLPECFVCGLGRERHDALRILTGPTENGDMAATVWSPSQAFADADGRIPTEIAWAALDCPGYYGLRQPDLKALLGEMSARILTPLVAGEAYVVAGWRTGGEGRKHVAGSALYDFEGNAVAFARTTWIELKA